MSGEDASARDREADADTDTADSEPYVHEPGAVEGEGDGDGEEAGSDAPAQPRNTPRDTAREFDWRGWVLVGVVVVAFLVVPGVLYLLPTARGAVAAIGLGWRNTYLVLPLLPALLLGAVAVWAAVRARAE